jgi:alkylhydroperoxidase family enzyme
VALIPYADEDPRDDRVRALVQRLPEPRINLFTMLANAPALAGPTLRLGEAILTKSDLDPVLRELVILRTARLTGSEYEWVQHLEIARLVGVQEEKIRAVERGQITDAVFDRPELLALELAGQLLDATPPPQLIRDGESELGRSQLLEVMLVTGYYAMLSGVMRAVQLDVDNVLEKGMLERERLTGGG